MAQAQAMQQNDKQAGPKTGLNAEEVRKMKGIDPLTLANKYQAAGVGQGPAKQELMVFISTSMPTKALVMLGQQAKATGAILVMRGMVAPLGTKGAMQKTMEALQPVGATGAQIQIDPEAFTRYNVKAVPTFVIASKDEGCSSDTFGMVTMQIVCTGTSLLGIWRWLVKPRLGRSRRYREDLNMLPVQRLISSTRSMQPCANSSVFANVRNRLNPQLAAQQER